MLFDGQFRRRHTASRLNYPAAGITARRMRAMLTRGPIERDNAGKYKLTVANGNAFAFSEREL